jgi:hypothetical protein
MKTLQRFRLSLTLVTLALALGTTALHAAIGDIAVTNDPYSAVSVTASTPLTVADPVAGAIKGGTGTTVTTAVLRITTNETANQKIQVSQTGVPTGASLTVELGAYSTTDITEVNSGNPITVTGTAADFITGINNYASNVDDANGLPLNYVLTLGENTPNGSATINVTYTILAQ